jgi:hypothetical protein
MAFVFFTVPIQDSGRAQEELNAFLRSHKSLSVDRRWVEQGASFWSFCIDYLEGTAAEGGGYRGGRGPVGKGKIDYRETLSPADFAVLARLRDVRKEIAQAEGVPVERSSPTSSEPRGCRVGRQRRPPWKRSPASATPAATSTAAACWRCWPRPGRIPMKRTGDLFERIVERDHLRLA